MLTLVIPMCVCATNVDTGSVL